MNLQLQSLPNSLTPFSLPSSQSLVKRRPRFQRQKSNNKCDCQSNSKNKSSCDSFSLSHLYVKKSFVKPSTPSKNYQNSPFSESIITISMDFGQSGKKNLDSTRIQNKNNSQQFDKSQLHKIDEPQILVQGFLVNSDSPDENKKQTEALLKKAIFYRQKCSKYELLIKDIRTQKSTLQIRTKMFVEEIQQLKSQINQLKSIIDDYISQDSETVTPTKKFHNKNLTKLKEQYHKFRQEEEFCSQSYEKKYLELNSKFQAIKHQNEQLRQDLAKQNELFNLKFKMMQQKQQFLQKNLYFTKNTLNQLQKDYEEKQGRILESKRLTEMITDKNKQIQTIKIKYENIVKMINGEKKRSESKKFQKDLSQKASIPCSSRSRHSLQVKSIVYNHKQNGQMSCTIKTNVQVPRAVQNLIQKKINSKKATHKENYQMSEVNKRANMKGREIQQKIQCQNIPKSISEGAKLRDSSSDLTLFSSNSLELSPQKSQN